MLLFYLKSRILRADYGLFLQYWISTIDLIERFSSNSLYSNEQNHITLYFDIYILLKKRGKPKLEIQIDMPKLFSIFHVTITCFSSKSWQLFHDGIIYFWCSSNSEVMGNAWHLLQVLIICQRWIQKNRLPLLGHLIFDENLLPVL